MPTRLEAREPAPSAARWSAPVGDVPDVNVWLALAVREHPHHPAARNWWKHGGQAAVGFNRVTMLAMVRLLCQPKVMGTGALTLAAALDVQRAFAALPEVHFLAEPEACSAQLHRLVVGSTTALPARLWTDAYLAAFAISGHLRLVTFDRDFERFDDLHLLRLPRDA